MKTIVYNAVRDSISDDLLRISEKNFKMLDDTWEKCKVISAIIEKAVAAMGPNDPIYFPESLVPALTAQFGWAEQQAIIAGQIILLKLELKFLMTDWNSSL
jgi:hypothetical protein